MNKDLWIFEGKEESWFHLLKDVKPSKFGNLLIPNTLGSLFKEIYADKIANLIPVTSKFWEVE